METLAESTVIRLRDQVLSGELPPGTQLQEVPLAKRFGVSRTPIREALTMLAHEGLVVALPRRGYEVRAFRAAEVGEAYELRATLEGMAARLLAERGLPPAAARKARVALDQCDALIAMADFGAPYHERWTALSHRFHTAILHATGSRMLVELVETTQRIPLANARTVHWYGTDRKYHESAFRAHREHHDVFDAIRNRQSARAEALMREHLSWVGRIALAHLRGEEKAGEDGGRQRLPSHRR
jgi:GntR family transcriptional regulator of vanillate catabolism